MQLNFDTYKDKVRACWVGKNIGGTIGAPYENVRDLLDIRGFSTPPGVVLPNDDLDLQLVWLFAMERLGINALDASTFGELWLSYITPYWNEYGIGKANLRRGLIPPLSGDYENNWRHSNGAWIRTEIFACTMPGLPDMAAKYSIEDAKVDHGVGEGTFAAAFVAAMQSAAFVVSDLRRCIDIGLAAIPVNCRTATSVRYAMDSYDNGKPWQETRNAILKMNCDIGNGWFEAPSNVAYAVIGLLYGEGDFKKSMLTAVNCADDADCTAATVGATLGILGGMEAIPQDWMQYIGDEIVTISINLGDVVRYKIPKTCTELTERVVALAPHTLYICNQVRANKVVFGEKNEIDENVAEELLKSVGRVRTVLENLKDYTMQFQNGFLSADVTLGREPEIAPGEELNVHICFRNNATFENMQHPLSLRWLLPEGFTVSGRSNLLLYAYNIHNNGSAEVDVTIKAGTTVSSENRVVLEVTSPGRHTALYIPILLLGR